MDGLSSVNNRDLQKLGLRDGRRKFRRQKIRRRKFRRID